MKFFGWIVVLTLSVGFLLPARLTSAHIVADDSSMEVTLHIDPQENPVVNHPQTLTIIYHDSTAKFNAFDCTCSVAINQNGRQIFQAAAPPKGLYFSQLAYTFAKADYYQIKISGKPKIAEVFAPFAVSYSVKVSPSPPEPSETYSVNSKIFYSVLAGVGALAAISLIYLVYFELKKQKSK